MNTTTSQVPARLPPGKDYEYEYDALYRLRKVKKTSNQALVAEYRYNGLGYKIAVHEDTDIDGDVDGSDLWYFDAFDERWRQVARFRESDSAPKEEFVHHQAGNDGRGGSSYIDLVVCRYKDANTAWTTASDGTLEERLFYCQNWRADVSAIVGSDGSMKEWVKYSAYGVPFGMPAGDTNSDGDCDAADVTQVQAWIDAPAYNLRGDVDLDADLDADDKLLCASDTLGRGVLSGLGTRSTTSLSGGHQHQTIGAVDFRRRLLSSALGRWLSRDPIVYSDGPSLVHYADSSPLVNNDPFGEEACGGVYDWTLTSQAIVCCGSNDCSSCNQTAIDAAVRRGWFADCKAYCDSYSSLTHNVVCVPGPAVAPTRSSTCRDTSGRRTRKITDPTTGVSSVVNEYDPNSSYQGVYSGTCTCVRALLAMDDGGGIPPRGEWIVASSQTGPLKGFQQASSTFAAAVATLAPMESQHQ